MEKVKRGRIVAVHDPKTIEVLELRVGYVKDRFGKLCRQDIKRPGGCLALTKTDHCAHGFRTTFSTLSHHEEIKDAKDGMAMSSSYSSRISITLL
ncbi:hypothetical protein [Bradyrhizobium sp. OAE829]|uniref:hypothetical protein n=1 Tax=Bradyrhizobium sp. OAE829 TaxID=2663807 RepID=UPI0019F1AD19